MNSSTRIIFILLALILGMVLAACSQDAPEPAAESEPVSAVEEPAAASNPRFDIYAPVTLSANLDHLSDNQK